MGCYNATAAELVQCQHITATPCTFCMVKCAAHDRAPCLYRLHNCHQQKTAFLSERAEKQCRMLLRMPLQSAFLAQAVRRAASDQAKAPDLGVTETC